jgi:hypothetical protein
MKKIKEIVGILYWQSLILIVIGLLGMLWFETIYYVKIGLTGVVLFAFNQVFIHTLNKTKE